jgi:transglutaminase-like putative cysteine protease
MLFHVIHATRYTYEVPVSHSLNEVRLIPRPLEAQAIQRSEIQVQPEPAFMYYRKDYYGNDISSFELFEKHDQLQITAESLVEVSASTAASIVPISWNAAQKAIAAQPDDATIEASEFIYNSPHVSVTPQLEDYAQASFVPGRSLLDAVQDLTHRINTDFKYRPQSTSISTPLAEVMKLRRGVCQDFAHVMIGAVRAQRLAVRYVSGYIRPGPKVQGAQASHAWVSVFFPGTGWIGFDPTNDLMVSDNHITLAWGRDYADVTPVKGISLGGGSQTVQVEVYVEPIETDSNVADASARS